jgi:hypothetical protein
MSLRDLHKAARTASKEFEAVSNSLTIDGRIEDTIVHLRKAAIALVIFSENLEKGLYYGR